MLGVWEVPCPAGAWPWPSITSISLANNLYQCRSLNPLLHVGLHTEPSPGHSCFSVHSLQHPQGLIFGQYLCSEALKATWPLYGWREVSNSKQHCFSDMDIRDNFPPEQTPESFASKKLWFYLEHNTSVTVYMRWAKLLSIVYLANKDLIESPSKAVGRILLPLNDALNCSDIVCR